MKLVRPTPRGSVPIASLVLHLNKELIGRAMCTCFMDACGQILINQNYSLHTRKNNEQLTRTNKPTDSAFRPGFAAYALPHTLVRVCNNISTCTCLHGPRRWLDFRLYVLSAGKLRGESGKSTLHARYAYVWPESQSAAARTTCTRACTV